MRSLLRLSNDVKDALKRATCDDRAHVLAWLCTHYSDNGVRFDREIGERRRQITLDGAALAGRKAFSNPNLTLSIVREVRYVEDLNQTRRCRATNPRGGYSKTIRSTTLFKGKDDLEDLLCGTCSAVLCESVTALTLKTRLGTSHQLIVVCPRCDAYNVLPSAFVPSSTT